MIRQYILHSSDTTYKALLVCPVSLPLADGGQRLESRDRNRSKIVYCIFSFNAHRSLIVLR